jgi:uncharacterized protein YecE (DUF72 family)
MGGLYLGLSGYSYKEWQGEGLFYPPELKQKQFLDYYASRFNALEADGTWYKMPGEAQVEKWISETDPGFLYSPKMHRKVTHFARLKPESIDALEFFLKRLAPLEQAGKLGTTLIQLPPNLGRDDERLATFLAAIPHRSSLPWAIEFRHDSWHCQEVETLLRSHNVAWVAADTDDADAQRRDTADHVYCRLRKTDYTDDMLRSWADYFGAKLNDGKSVTIFGKHEDAERPWEWVDRLRDLLR